MEGNDRAGTLHRIDQVAERGQAIRGDTVGDQGGQGHLQAVASRLQGAGPPRTAPAARVMPLLVECRFREIIFIGAGELIDESVDVNL